MLRVFSPNINKRKLENSNSRHIISDKLSDSKVQLSGKVKSTPSKNKEAKVISKTTFATRMSQERTRESDLMRNGKKRDLTVLQNHNKGMAKMLKDRTNDLI